MSVPGQQKASSQKLVPLKIGQAEFLRSNVFVAWSPKMGREIRLVGPGLFDAWLLLEFDPDVIEFCERPALAIGLSVNEERSRSLDFWVRRRSGLQHGVVVHDAVLSRDASIPLELLQRSVERADFACRIWLAADIGRRRIYLRNLKQLLPYLAQQLSPDIELEELLLAHVNVGGGASWMDLVSFASFRSIELVHVAIASLIHAGKLRADLSEPPLSNSTLLEGQ
ncbi:hypothetical protein [Dyella sp. Tek66A03]|uniref:hypothetical protein n=1 Tax=Dyella sp. Tek66A03 TaxID=3458298 RepID=UPI00403EC190